MSRYGINYYGLANYGTESTVVYAASNFMAASIDYATIKLTWNSPTGSWSRIKLVRNSYGFPLNERDGTVLDIRRDGLYQAYKETDPVVYVDTDLAPNAFYYYSLFVFEKINYKWVKVGDIIGLAVNDYGYSSRLYDYLPEIYTTSTATEVSTRTKNETLANFLKVFGFQLDEYHTYTNLINTRYDTSKLYGNLIPPLLQELGEAYEPELGYQQARILARDAVELNKAKGTSDGLREFLKAFTGWAVPGESTAPNPNVNGIVIGHNIMLDYNDSSFEESTGHWKSSDGTATIACLKKRNVTKYQIISNIATLTVGAHQYAVGHKVIVSGSSKPIFNTASVSISAVTSTTISFSLTSSDILATDAWNYATSSYPVVSPTPSPWNELTAPAGYSNKQSGIMSVNNASASSQTVNLECGKVGSPVQQGIPVTTGLPYTFSIYTTNATTSTNVKLGIKWYDRLQNLLSSSVASSGTASGTGAFSARPTFTATAPAKAYYAIPTISIASMAESASNAFQYFDCAQFEQASAATSFDEARQLHIVLKASRINELINPHFALISGTTSAPIVTPWTVTGPATKTLDVLSQEPESVVWDLLYKSSSGGTARLETVYTHDYKIGDTVVVHNVGAPFDGAWAVTNVGERVNNALGVVTNYPYIEFALTGTVARTLIDPANDAQVWRSGNSLKLTGTGAGNVTIKSWDGTTNSQQMPIYYPGSPYAFSFRASISEYDGTGPETVTPFIEWYNSARALISTSTGTPYSVTKFETEWDRPSIVATSPSTAAYAVVGITWASASTHKIWFDASLFEQANSIFSFFDGNSGYGELNDFAWEGGLTNAARSHYYKNKYTVLGRTGTTSFNDKFVLGTTYALYLVQPQT